MHQRKTAELFHFSCFTVWWQNSEASFCKHSGTKKCMTGSMLSIHSWLGRSGKARDVWHRSCYDVLCSTNGFICTKEVSVLCHKRCSDCFFLFNKDRIICICLWWFSMFVLSKDYEVVKGNLRCHRFIMVIKQIYLASSKISRKIKSHFCRTHQFLHCHRSKLGRRSRHTSGGSHPNTLSVPTKWDTDNPRYKQSLSHWLLHQSLTSSTT